MVKQISPDTGTKEGLPHWYYGWSNANLYESTRNNVPNNIYIQDLTGGLYRDGAIVYDALGGARKTYLIRSGFWLEWSKDSDIHKGGPRSELGAPISNEYGLLPGSNPARFRQDFQRGYLQYEQGAKPEIIYYFRTMPGMYVDGWHPDTSYAFAKAYEDNGAAINLGSADNNPNENPFIHTWPIDKPTVLIQDFYRGNWIDSAIIYNPNDGNAYVIRTGFWQHYRTKNGPDHLGAPKEDEHGNTLAKPCGYISCQTFEKGELWWNGNTVTEYSLDCSALGGYIPPQCQTLYPVQSVPAAPVLRIIN